MLRARNTFGTLPAAYVAVAVPQILYILIEPSQFMELADKMGLTFVIFK